MKVNGQRRGPLERPSDFRWSLVWGSLPCEADCPLPMKGLSLDLGASDISHDRRHRLMTRPRQKATYGLLRPCLGCGVPVPDSRCEECADLYLSEHPWESGKRLSKAGATERGYDSKWQRLSKQARRLQPWCTICGCPDDLTGDHLVWPAKSLSDVQVLCRSCNSSKGPLRTKPHSYA